MIVEITRSYVRISVGEKTVKVEGEAYAPGYGSPNFVAYANSIRKWDPPDDAVEIDNETKAEILRLLRAGMDERNMTIEIE